MDISFPHLGIEIPHLIDGVTVFGFTIKFYAILITIGMIAGVALAARNARVEKLGDDYVYDFALWAIPLGVLGARLYYVIFQWEYYRDDLLKIFNLREGGLAIYGGVIMAFVTSLVFTRVKKISYWHLMDCCIASLILGQAIGRWGNFFNCEVFGGYTDSLFAMRINRALVSPSYIAESLNADMLLYQPDIAADYIQVQPTFLYESVWNLLVFLVIMLRRKHRKFEGELCGIYLLGYGIGRFWIEGIRTDQLYLWNTHIPVSQVVSVALILAGLTLFALGFTGHLPPHVMAGPAGEKPGKEEKEKEEDSSKSPSLDEEET